VSRVIEKMRPAFGVEPVCRALGVPVSTHDARRTRMPSERARRDSGLVREIHAARSGYRQVYGVRKTWRELARRGVVVGRDRVARLMRAEGLEGVRRGLRPRTTTPAENAAERARDLVGRRFAADRPNALWVADLTYIRTFCGFSYLAFILDVFSRRIVGWQIATHMRTELVLDALEMAVALRQPDAGLVAHSDRGSQPKFKGPSQHCRFVSRIVVRWPAVRDLVMSMDPRRRLRRRRSRRSDGRRGTTWAPGGASLRKRVLVEPFGERPARRAIYGDGGISDAAQASRWALSASAGVRQPSVLRGRPLSASATAASSSGPCLLRLVPLGKYWRSRPLVFSLLPRCQGLWGSQK
jgi:transposase InsO family protein